MTGNELVAFARGKIGTPYVYGMKGKVLTQKTYDRLRILFGPLVWESDAAKIPCGTRSAAEIQHGSPWQSPESASGHPAAHHRRSA